jgi:hypothetical protein
VEDQAHEAVVHLEKAASEMVGPVRHDIWDVHCPESRWWVVTNQTNLYDQADFKSRDVVLTFHVGLMLRMEYGQERDVPVTPEAAELLPGSWRRCEQGSSVRQRQRGEQSGSGCGSASSRSWARRATTSWCRPIRRHRRLRTSRAGPNYWPTAWRQATRPPGFALPEEARRQDLGVRQLADPCQNAMRMDAEIGLKSVEHLLGMFTAARLRLARTPKRCSVQLV